MPTNSTTPELLSDEALKEIEARANAATPGDWTIRGASWIDGGVKLAGYGVRFADDPFGGCYTGWDARTNYAPDQPEGKQASSDRAFIAHAREDIPALCQSLRAAWAEKFVAEDLLHVATESLRKSESENAALRDQVEKERSLLLDAMNVALPEKP